MVCYRSQDAFEAVVDFVIWKTDDLEAILMQKLRALGIVSKAAIRSVLTTIKFNDEHRLKAHKIHDIRPNRLLPAEFEGGELPAAQGMPKLSLNIRLTAPQLPGEFVLHNHPRQFTKGTELAGRNSV